MMMLANTIGIMNLIILFDILLSTDFSLYLYGLQTAVNLLREYLGNAIRVKFPPLPGNDYGGVNAAAMEDVIEWIDDAWEDPSIKGTASCYWPGPY